MRIYYTDVFELPLPDGHRFPMAKYRLLRQRVDDSDIRSGCKLLVPRAASDEQLKLVHAADYVRRVTQGKLTPLEIRRIGFPWSEQMVERSRRSTGASIDAAVSALRDRIALNLAGGTHHAFPDSGQGYCVFNDVAVACRVLQAEHGLQRVLIIDCDVHQGNGTAAIFHRDPDVYTFSMHCDKNYPFRKMQSTLDVELPVGTGDFDYLRQLDQALHRIEREFVPEFVFYVSGADPYEFDRLGQLKLTRQGLSQRDQRVFEFCQELQVPCVATMAGGYAPQLGDIIEIHFQTVVQAFKHFRNGVDCNWPTRGLG